ncbi:MAG: FMN-binding protein [Candidatus Izemoplasmataceae bacterium]
MSQYVKMLVFVLALALGTSGVLLGMEELTAERIEANAEIELQQTILDAYDISYTTTNINDVFESSVEIIEEDGLTLYVDRNSGAVSFEFIGGGVWGPISGVLTLESDYETIRSVAVLQQEETPGLGGVVANPQYLATFEGILMTPELMIEKDTSDNDPNEVDSITGATRTSDAFELILNNAYEAHQSMWQNLEN